LIIPAPAEETIANGDRRTSWRARPAPAYGQAAVRAGATAAQGGRRAAQDSCSPNWSRRPSC